MEEPLLIQRYIFLYVAILHLHPVKSMTLPTCIKVRLSKGFVGSASESVGIEGLSLEKGGLLYQKCTFSV